LHGSHVAWQEQKIPFPMGKEVLSYAKYFYCSCHATWLPCKTSIGMDNCRKNNVKRGYCSIVGAYTNDLNSPVQIVLLSPKLTI